MDEEGGAVGCDNGGGGGRILSGHNPSDSLEVFGAGLGRAF